MFLLAPPCITLAPSPPPPSLYSPPTDWAAWAPLSLFAPPPPDRLGSIGLSFPLRPPDRPGSMGSSGCAATAPSCPPCVQAFFLRPAGPTEQQEPSLLCGCSFPGLFEYTHSFQPPDQPGGMCSFGCAVEASFRPLPSSSIQGQVLPPVLCHPSPFPDFFLDYLSGKQAHTERINS